MLTEGEREGRGENLQEGLFWIANPTRQQLLLESRRQCIGWLFVFIHLSVLWVTSAYFLTRKLWFAYKDVQTAGGNPAMD